MKKILLLGSAGYIRDWYAQHGDCYIADGYLLAAMNNAWSIDPGRLTFWIRSEDYFLMPGTKRPDDCVRNRWHEIVKVLDVPFFYSKGREGGTMLLNSICHFMNHCFYSDQKLWIVIAGSDLVYKQDGKDHFYGQGQPDPLMVMGKEMLQKEMMTLKILAEQLGHKILNCGGQAETLLPFARFAL